MLEIFLLAACIVGLLYFFEVHWGGPSPRVEHDIFTWITGKPISKLGHREFFGRLLPFVLFPIGFTASFSHFAAGALLMGLAALLYLVLGRGPRA